MPTLTRWHLKASFACLLLSLSLWTLQASSGLWTPPELLRALAPPALHLFLVGWVAQAIFGVSYWMFPKASREDPRGSPILAWAAFGGLNLGLVLRLLSEPMLIRVEPTSPGSTCWGVLLLSSGLLQLAAFAAWIANTWKRVRGMERRRR